jgi:uncharacterized protein (TIGR00730 family)
MDGMINNKDPRIADAWSDLRANIDGQGQLVPISNRLAFADAEFLLRRETRGIRFQLELLKPDLAQQELGIDHTVVVFGGARFKSEEQAHLALEQAKASGNPEQIKKAQVLLKNAAYYEKARAFANLVTHDCKSLKADEKFYICTGGGPGIMEAANRGAQEAGGLSVGLNIALPHEQEPNPYISPNLSFKFHYFALRKMHFMMRAKALVAFPGGFGTMDELFETLTLIQCKKAKPVPVILFGSDYWKRLFNPHMLVEEGAINEEDLDLFHYVDDIKEAWKLIQDFYKQQS